MLPRLDWSDRYFDMVQQKQNELSKKLIIAGSALLCNDEQKYREDKLRESPSKGEIWNNFKKDQNSYIENGNKSASKEGGNKNSNLKMIDQQAEKQEILDLCKPYIMIYDRRVSQPKIIKIIQS